MKITFLGAAREVTGSCYLVEAAGHRFLVDHGMFQGGSDAYRKNRATLRFDPGTIEFVVLTHAHIDHSGLLPRLVELWQRPDRDLAELVKGTAMTRAKLPGLRRNLAVTIGNAGDPAARAALAEEREDQSSTADPMVREHIDWALRQRLP